MLKASLSLLLGLAAALPVSAQTPERTSRAQAEPSKPAEGDAPPPRRQFTLFGDSARFTRMGGWGGMAGTLSQFGLTKAMLVMMPGVQKELEMSDKQKEAMKDWAETFRKRGEELAQKAGLGPPQNQGEGGQGGGMNIASQMFKMMNFMSTLNGFFKEAEDAANKILTKKQQVRLSQISLQMEGLSALARADVAQQMNLDPQQFEAIQNILNGVKTGQMTYWIGQMTQMAANGGFRRPGGNGPRGQGPNGPGGPPGGFGQGGPGGRFGGAQGRFGRPGATDPTRTQARAETTKDAKPEEPEDPAAAEKQRKEREAAREAMRKRFDTMQQGSDAIQNQAMNQILKLLTKGQKARFEKMLGEPFDPNKLIEPPDPRGELAAAAAAKAKAAKAGATTKADPEGVSRPTTLRERRLGKAAAPPQ